MYRHLSVRVFEVSRVRPIPFSFIFSPRCSRPDVALDPAGLLVASSSLVFSRLAPPFSRPHLCPVTASPESPAPVLLIDTLSRPSSFAPFHPRRLLLSFTIAYLHLPLVIPFSHNNIIYT